jgi:energy-coupling factor transporter ATP-binding protein EcfA2
MFRRLVVENFQSLTSVALDLQPFTVIVGASNSGKSATVRALHALVNNVNGPAAVTAGRKSFVIRATLDSGENLLIERGSGKGEYRLQRPDQDQIILTKIGKTVPDEITELLAMGPINFAGQFDRPFLLADSTTDVARALGAITSVDLIYAAQREASRVATVAGSELRTRERDLEQAQTELKKFTYLKAQAAALREAKDLIDKAQKVENRLAGVSTLRSTVTVCLVAIRQAKAQLASSPDLDIDAATAKATALADIRTLIRHHDVASCQAAQAEQALAASRHADLSKAELTAAKLNSLREARRLAQTTASYAAELEGRIPTLASEAEQAEHDRLLALEEQGTCPTCGASTKEIAVARTAG